MFPIKIVIELRWPNYLARFTFETFATSPDNDNDPSETEKEEMKELLDKYDK